MSSTLYSLHCRAQSVHNEHTVYRVYTVNPPMPSVQCKVYTVHCTEVGEWLIDLFAVPASWHWTLYCALYTVNCTFTVHCNTVLYTVQYSAQLHCTLSLLLTARCSDNNNNDTHSNLYNSVILYTIITTLSLISPLFLLKSSEVALVYSEVHYAVHMSALM